MSEQSDDRRARNRDDVADDRAEQVDMRRERERAAFLEAAEKDSLRRVGRGLSAEELDRILRWYPAEE